MQDSSRAIASLGIAHSDDNDDDNDNNDDNSANNGAKDDPFCVTRVVTDEE